jgi:D-alanyl-D-alanine dipeptidase
MKYEDKPIVWAPGKWDDTGYRAVAIPKESDPDPLLPANDRLACYRVYHYGDRPRVCSCYGAGGMDKSDVVFLREPVIRSLEQADGILKQYGLKLLVVDGFRSVYTQAALWTHTLCRISNGRNPSKLTTKELLTLGLQADVIGSYAPVLQNWVYDQAFGGFFRQSSVWYPIVEYAQEQFDQGKTPEEWLALYITFKTNLGLFPSLSLDTTGHTSHGNGGTEDSLLVSIAEDNIACLGAPYDYPGKESAIDFFEHDENFGAWKDDKAKDQDMRQYLAECGINRPVIMDDFHRIRDLRRVFYWAMEEVGAGRYGPEYWHRTHNHDRGGKQANQHPGAGNSCHAITQSIHGSDGQYLAVWGNDAAHQMSTNF